MAYLERQRTTKNETSLLTDKNSDGLAERCRTAIRCYTGKPENKPHMNGAKLT